MASYTAANELREGSIFEDSGNVYVVTKYQHIKKARAQAVIRVKVKDIESGNTTEKTYSSDHKLQDVDVSKRSAQFMYSDDTSIYLMDQEDFEQIEFPISQLTNDSLLLKEGTKLVVSYLNGRVITVDFPLSVVLKVVSAPEVNVGGTVSNPTKRVELETGLMVDVPVFINSDDSIKINTLDLSYISRA